MLCFRAYIKLWLPFLYCWPDNYYVEHRLLKVFCCKLNLELLFLFARVLRILSLVTTVPGFLLQFFRIWGASILLTYNLTIFFFVHKSALMHAPYSISGLARVVLMDCFIWNWVKNNYTEYTCTCKISAFIFLKYSVNRSLVYMNYRQQIEILEISKMWDAEKNIRKTSVNMKLPKNLHV